MTYSASPFGPSIPLVYIETTIPPGMTIDEYWRSRPQRRSRWHRLLQYARSVARSARWRPRTRPDEAPQPVRSPAQESGCRRRHVALKCDRPARASSRLLLVAGRESCTSEHRPGRRADRSAWRSRLPSAGSQRTPLRCRTIPPSSADYAELIRRQVDAVATPIVLAHSGAGPLLLASARLHARHQMWLAAWVPDPGGVLG
jgi:hypothetical protein